MEDNSSENILYNFEVVHAMKKNIEQGKTTRRWILAGSTLIDQGGWGVSHVRDNGHGSPSRELIWKQEPEYYVGSAPRSGERTFRTEAVTYGKGLRYQWARRVQEQAGQYAQRGGPTGGMERVVAGFGFFPECDRKSPECPEQGSKGSSHLCFHPWFV